MCGLIGFSGRAKPALLRKALATILHRGPDDEGFYEEDGISLAHKRLSIIDLQGGHQPMASADRRYWIVFNGEIYNYKELRQELIRLDFRFQTASDTEVLLYWLVAHGTEGLARINGMFAFAFWDQTMKRLLLARDRLGIKPLYYRMDDGHILFASEIKAMIPLMPSVGPNSHAIFEFLTFQNNLSDHTFFKDVDKLAPGHWLQWNPDSVCHGKFWDFDFSQPDTGSCSEVVERYRHTLDRAMDRHMISDVPIGSYVSSGIDSPSVATLAAARNQEPFPTFIGAFADAPYYDERPGARVLVKKIGGHLHDIEITPQHFVDNIGKVIYHLDEPMVGTGALPQYMVAKLVAQHVKVVLTGHGGDETFAGYQVNKVVLIKESIRQNPWSLFSVLSHIRLDEWTRVLYYLLYPILYPEVGHGIFIMTPKKRRSHYFSNDFLQQNKGYEPLDHISKILGDRPLSESQKILILYVRTYLATLLVQEDKMGMAHSLEARMPLCDNEMLELSLSLPLSLKLHGNVLKALPKMAMKPYLPDILYQQPKRGFPTPFARWSRIEPMQGMIYDLLFSQRSRERGLFDTKNLHTLFERNRKSSSDTLYDYARFNMLYSFSMVELWFRTFMDQKEAKPIF